jgi:hypothetical protein
MSTEGINNTDTQDLTGFTTPKTGEKKRTARVDINHLLARVRKEKEADKVNLLLFGLFLAIFIIAVLILTF